MKTEQQLQNIREALQWWPTIGPEQVATDLGCWIDGEATACGTVACFGGHCVYQPSLIAQGIRGESCGAPYLEVEDLWDFEVAAHLFGDSQLFMWRGGHDADEGFTGTDHELVTYRLEYALAQG